MLIVKIGEIVSWITQGFVIAASISVIGASAAVVYSLIKGRAILGQANTQLVELTEKTQAKRTELNGIVDALATFIKE